METWQALFIVGGVGAAAGYTLGYLSNAAKNLDSAFDRAREAARHREQTELAEERLALQLSVLAYAVFLRDRENAHLRRLNAWKSVVSAAKAAALGLPKEQAEVLIEAFPEHLDEDWKHMYSHVDPYEDGDDGEEEGDEC